MNTVSFKDFSEEDVRKFQVACEKHGLAWTDFYVLGLLAGEGEHTHSSMRIRVEYLPTGKSIQYLSGHSMSWLVSFDIDLGKNLFA